MAVSPHPSIEAMSPKELYLYAKDEFLDLAMAPQVQRDALAKQLVTTYDAQCLSAAERGDEVTCLSYWRAARLISRVIEKALYGASFERY